MGDRTEVARRRIGWFSLGFVMGAVGMFLALAKVLADHGWSLGEEVGNG